MHNSSHEGLRALADQALGVYLEDLVAGRKVLYLGDASTGVPHRLGLSARSVYAIDVAASATPQVRDNVTVVGPPPGAIATRETSFDVVIVPDLVSIGASSPERLEEIRRSVSPGGVLVAGVFQGGPGALSYEELHGLLSQTFEAVRMIGQAPLAGFAVVDFAPADGEPSVTFDQSLLEDEPEGSERYLALCGRDSVALDSYAVVQVRLSRFIDSRRVLSAPVRSDDPSAFAAELETKLLAQKEELAGSLARAREIEASLSGRTAALAELDGEVERLRLELAAVREESETQSTALRTARVELERLRAAPPPPAEDSGDEHARLEEALAERAHLVTDLRREVERRGVIVRDVVEELSEARRALESAGSGALGASLGEGGLGLVPAGVERAGGVGGVTNGLDKLRRERDNAVERALGAETARAEAQLTLDELRGRLAQAESARGGERDARAEAELAGVVRGLRARVAEAQEEREGLEARLALARHDRAQASERILELERALSEARNQFELELVRARSRATDPSRVGEVAGAEIARLRDAELALSAEVGTVRGKLAAALERAASDRDERDHARVEAIRLTALVAGLEEKDEGARRGYEARIAHLVHDLEVGELRQSALRSEIDALKGECDGLRARLGDREASLVALSAGAGGAARSSEESAESQRKFDTLRDEADTLRAELAELRVTCSSLTERSTDAEGRGDVEARRAADLASALAARDAIVLRLETDLAEREQRIRTHEQSAAALGNETAGLREALAATSAASDAREELGRRRAQERDRALTEAQTRAVEAETERDRLADALSEARNALEQLAASVQSASVMPQGEALRDRIAADGKSVPPPAGASDAETESLRASLARADGELGQIRSRIDVLTRDAEDREVLMRSLVAQLEERDDRIRALERRIDGGPGGSSGGDEEQLGRELLELKERVGRLTEELTHERASRRSAESEIDVVRQSRRQEHESDIRRLHELLGDRDAEVVIVQSRATRAERDLIAMRDAITSARAGLESLLSTATSQGDPATADRVGQLLKMLTRA